MADDVPNSTATPWTIPSPWPGWGYSDIDYSGDSDWWRVQLVAGTQYQIDMLGASADGASVLTLADPKFMLRDATGAPIWGVPADNGAVGFNARAYYTPSTSGTYYLDGQGSGVGSYRFVVQAPSVSNFLTPGTTVQGTVDFSYESDLYYIELTAGVAYTFTLTGNSLSDPFLELIGVGWNDNSVNLNSRINYTPSSTGGYWLLARGSRDATGSYTLAATATASDTQAPYVVAFSPVDEATGVAVGTNVQLTFNEAIQRGSGTIYLRTLGGTLVESFDAATSPRLTLSGSTLTIDPSTNLPGGGSYRVDFNAGTVRDLAGNSWAGTASYNFTTTTTTGTDTIPGTTATTASVEVLKELTSPVINFYSSIDYSGDSDWVSVAMTAGRQYMIWLSGTGTSGLVHPRLSLHNANSAELASADSTSNTASLVYTPTVTGTYYLNARSPDSIGTYAIQVAGDALASTATESWMNVNSYGQGYLNYSAADTADWIRVELVAGKRYQLDAIGSVGDSWSDALGLADPSLNLRDRYGTLLKSDNDSGAGLSPRIFYTPATSGTYYLDVRSAQATYGQYRAVVNEVPVSPDMLVPGTPIQGTVQFLGDSNLYGIQLTAGLAYTFTLTGDTLSDPFLELLDSQGSVIKHNDDSAGLNSSISYTPSATGLFHLAARASAWQTGSYTLSASVGAGDTNAPVVTSFSPADEATGVAVGTNVVLTFNEPIQRGIGFIWLRTAGGALIETFDAATSSRLSITGSTLTIDPSSTLWSSTGYRVEFAAGTVRDLAGNAYAGTSAYNFTTSSGDFSAPIVLGFTPADEATGVARDTNVQLTFNEPVQRGSGTISLRTASGVLVEAFDAATSSRLSITGSTLTIDPSSNLSGGTGYRVEFEPDTVRDLSGNAYAGTSAYNFTTLAGGDSTAPTVLSFSPADEATGVARGTNIELTFSEPIQRGSGIIWLRTASGAIVELFDAASSSRLSISGNTLTIDPSIDLASGTRFRVDFGLGTVRDLAGNNYAGTNSYNFKTAAEDGDAVIVLTFHTASALTFTATDHFFTLVNAITGNVVEVFNTATSPLLKLVGNTLTIDPSVKLPSGSYRVEIPSGAVSDMTGKLLEAMTLNFSVLDTDFSAGPFVQTIVGTPWADGLVGSGLADALRGLDGNDTMNGHAGNDLLNGGPGRDTAVFSGERADYLLTSTIHGLTVSGPDGSDLLIDVERLLFADINIAFDVEGNAGKAYRLYQAAFNRTPDIAGLGYQMNALDIGWGITDIAHNFLDSPEFQRTYGSLNNVEFVTLLYRNVLHRAPDADGLNFHVTNIENGLPRWWVLVGFSESPENQAALIGTIENGMAYTL